MATAPFTCFAIAAPGLEPIVAQELKELGEQPRIEEGGVEWDGDAQSVARANLWLRSASRVLVRVAQFPATAFFEVEKRARKIPWHEYLAPDTTPTFRVTTRKSRLYHSDAVAERLATSAARATRPAGGGGRGKKPPSHTRRTAAAPTTPESGREQLFVVRVAHDVVTISADTSGELLHKRGYRLAVAKAPLRETLAAALLLASGWSGDTPLIDPFCGSGTIPIEGALIAQHVAPGVGRRFAFAEWPSFDLDAWASAVADARARALASSPVEIVGSDRDAGAITDSRGNAQRAGADARFEVKSISDAPALSKAGAVATNPPYGVRVGDSTTMRNLYARFGDVLRERFPGWRLAMYVSDLRLARHMKLDLRTLYHTTNGGLKVAAVTADVPT